jgi:hypothetical protein
VAPREAFTLFAVAENAVSATLEPLSNQITKLEREVCLGEGIIRSAGAGGPGVAGAMSSAHHDRTTHGRDYALARPAFVAFDLTKGARRSV